MLFTTLRSGTLGPRISGPRTLRSTAIVVRTVYVSSRRPNEKYRDWAREDTERVKRERELGYARKMKELTQLTKELRRSRTRVSTEGRGSERDEIVEGPGPRTLGPRSSSGPNSKTPGPNSKTPGPNSKTSGPRTSGARSLVTPSTPLPTSIINKLGLAARYLVSKTHANWPIAIKTLAEEGVTDISEKDLRKLVYAIPHQDLAYVIPQLESLFHNSHHQLSPKIMNRFIESLSRGGTISRGNLARIELYVERIRAGSPPGVKPLPRRTYELLISVYGKCNKLSQIDAILQEMKSFKLSPSPAIYSNVLKTYVYKSRDHKQATAVFDTMKFLSHTTRPNTDAYNDIIVSYVNNNDVEKALDLYQDMIDGRIEVNQSIMVALSRGCSQRPGLLFKSWEFMLEIYDRGWTPRRETLEYMISLAAHDGDTALARVIFKKLAAVGSITRRSVTFLLQAYGKSRVQAAAAATPAAAIMDPPIVSMHEKGRLLRRTLLSEFNSVRETVPMLPVLDVTTAEEIMAESGAIWRYIVEEMPEVVSVEGYNTYLNVAAEFGTEEEFLGRYGESSHELWRESVQGRDLGPKDPDPKDLDLTHSLGPKDLDPKDLDPKDLDPKDLDPKDLEPGPLRNTFTYIIGLKAAGNLKSYQLAQQIWTERGHYRKTNQFRTLSPTKKNQLDFEFANSMVQSLTKMKHLLDALAVILSTEYQFKWSWNQLRPIHKEFVEAGMDKQSRTVRNIALRAQVRFEGKVDRRRRWT